jgi:hypothetical protein
MWMLLPFSSHLTQQNLSNCHYLFQCGVWYLWCWIFSFCCKRYITYLLIISEIPTLILQLSEAKLNLSVGIICIHVFLNILFLISLQELWVITFITWTYRLPCFLHDHRNFCISNKSNILYWLFHICTGFSKFNVVSHHKQVSELSLPM